jgi:hypothetical protein
MKRLRTERLDLIPVDARNARELWRVLNAPDLRKYQDIPRIPAEDFRVAAADAGRTGARDRLDLAARERPLAPHR